jgi:hypothetical protein
MDRTVTFKEELISGHEPRTGLDTKTDKLTDCQLQCDSDSELESVQHGPTVTTVTTTPASRKLRDIESSSSRRCQRSPALIRPASRSAITRLLLGRPSLPPTSPFYVVVSSSIDIPHQYLFLLSCLHDWQSSIPFLFPSRWIEVSVKLDCYSEFEL